MPSLFASPTVRVCKAALFFVMMAAILSSCSTFEQVRISREKRAENARLSALRAEAREPHAAWRAKPKWKSKTYRNESVLARATADNTSIEISLGEQRGLLLVDGAIAMDFPVATGKRSHPSPTGDFKIRGKEKEYSSNLYGKIVDSAGEVLNANADARTDIPPEGAQFVGAKMPFWMRITDSGVGMHVGYVPGHPASHGCIRLQQDVAVQLFGMLKVGTPVKIAQTAPALDAAPPAKSR